MIVYHGSNVIVRQPDTLHSYRPLDFGRGFYVTSNQSQAERWARRKYLIYREGNPLVNEYRMDEDFSGLNVKTFGDDPAEWIEFVCSCRDGNDDFALYDIIIGRVADDKVFRVVDKYRSGEWDLERALSEIKVYPDYDQISFVTHKAIDRVLTFSGYRRC